MKLLTVKPLASVAVSVAGKGAPWVCGEAIVLHWKPASGPTLHGEDVLVPACPTPLTTCSVTLGSMALTVTFPVHAPEAKLTDEGVIGMEPPWSEPVSVPGRL